MPFLHLLEAKRAISLSFLTTIAQKVSCAPEVLLVENPLTRRTDVKHRSQSVYLCFFAKALLFCAVNKMAALTLYNFVCFLLLLVALQKGRAGKFFYYNPIWELRMPCYILSFI